MDAPDAVDNGVTDNNGDTDDTEVADDTAAADATPFVFDVDQDLVRDGEAPSGSALTDEEVAAIEQQVQQIIASNAGRPSGQQISVDPDEVN